MKKQSIFYSISFLLFGLSLFSQSANYKVFPFKSGVIEYAQEGNAKGTHIKYFDDYGYKQADFTETVTKVFGFSTKENKQVILIGPKVYTIDKKKNSATVVSNPVYKMYANSEAANYEELGEESLTSLGYSNTGKRENILGKPCQIWEGSLGEIWLWKGMTLKSKVSVLGIKITEVAIKIDVPANVSASKFELPKGVEIEETQLPEGMGGMFGAEQGQMSSEDKKAMKQVADMSYEEFRDMVKKEDPNMSEEEIKQNYKMTKQLSKFFK